MSLSNPKVSVIIPLYNVIDLIEETMQSLLKQTLNEVEYIFIDDESSDGTYERALDYEQKHLNIKVIRQASNMGVSAARNKGIKEANGDYVFFMDSDDLLLENSIETLYYAAITNDADLVTGVHASFTDGVVASADMFTQFPRLQVEGEKILHENTELFYLIYCWGKLFKRELVKNITFPEGVNYFEDQPFIVNAYINASKIYSVPSVTYYHRKRSGVSQSLTQLIQTNLYKHMDDLIEAIELSTTYITKKKIGEECLKLLIGYLNRVLLWNVWYILSSAIGSKNSDVTIYCLTKINNWVTTVEDNIVLHTQGFQVIMQEANKYSSLLDANSMKQLVNLMRNILGKMEAAKRQTTNY
ncbi:MULTISPECIES: glycosyltransferase family 2 protein [unclassified Niallia]|uniref:glycosyltransferase family 2 protein n=1 Tax=unclassified Niallia TaxID=2837522 RepID=UPI001EDA1C14|nr:MULTISPECIES: glycosyltransferase family 2 protein [unclassified Niallia]MDL0437815.1 glycosyltransferase family 2 protein [Niallia sp. SS-2023]UPO87207.1 glycosyltransferase [Niallia sp. Man26]